MSLKIIAGEYGSRVLKGVKGNHTRPLLGQVREALFNIIQDWTSEAEVWDLFAGDWKLESLGSIAQTIGLGELGEKVPDLLAGRSVGRTVVDVRG